MVTTEPSLREEYARYFFSLFDACLHQDDVGRREAQRTLEESLTRIRPDCSAELA